MDDSLQSYARARLLRSRPDADHRSIDAYVASPAFAALAVTLDKNLMNELDRFLAGEWSATPMTQSATPESTPPAQELANVRPYALPELAAPAPATTAQAAETPPAAAHVEAAPPDEQLPSMAANPLFAEPRAPQPPVTQQGRPAQPATAPAPQAELADIAFRLPNARAGTAYSQRLETPGGREAIVFEELILPDELGLRADLDTGTVSGTPALAGDHRLTVVYRSAGQPHQRRAHVLLTVTPDPRTMWKNLPSERSDPYWKEDEACAAVQGPDMRIVAASKRGRSHAHAGGFRDDDYRIDYLGDSGWCLAVVADGAGSARFSRRGATLICEEASKRIEASLSGAASARIDAAVEAYAQARSEERDALHADLHSSLSRIVGNAAYYAVRAIMEETGARPDLGGTFKDYASTALIGICKRYPFGTLCAAYWVGDGAIGVYSQRDGITLLGDVDSGEFSGQTRFLDTAAIEHDMLLKRTRFGLVEDMTAFVLMTDGVSDAKFETEARLQRAADWHAFWNELDDAAGFADPAGGQERRLLDWLDFWSQGNHDDRTIAVIHPSDSSGT